MFESIRHVLNLKSAPSKAYAYFFSRTGPPQIKKWGALSVSTLEGSSE